MKRAGDILSALFDERLLKKARGYSKLFDSWADVTEKNGIAAAADHSRIKDMDRGILWLEVDHPGWKQILQTKAQKILGDYRRRFPELDISGISIMLGKAMPQAEPAAGEPSAGGNDVKNEPPPQAPAPEQNQSMGYDAIKDECFKKSLKRLERSIAHSAQK